MTLQELIAEILAGGNAEDLMASFLQDPAVFVVVAGSYELDGREVVEDCKYIGPYMTLTEAKDELDRHASRAFARIEAAGFKNISADDL